MGRDALGSGSVAFGLLAAARVSQAFYGVGGGGTFLGDFLVRQMRKEMARAMAASRYP